MADAALDTHKLVKKLTASGFSEDAAEALAEALLERRDDLVTKPDLDAMEQRLQHELRADITAAKLHLVLILLPSMAALLAVFKYLP